MPQINIVAMPFAELAASMREGTLTSEQLVEECLLRIGRLNSSLHAFISVFPEAAIDAARRLDAERVDGRVRGPLHGIPIAVKDLVDIEGQVTGFGSRAYGSAPAIRTALFLRQLEEAGMVVIGKTQMVEFAFGSWGTNAALGSPRNPRIAHRHYIAGGSSSGSAVAVAADLVPAAIGSDTGGSVRIPAALCGTVGLKTTIGAVSTEGVAPLCPAFDTIGPLTHHVDDARMIFEAMQDPGRSHRSPETASGIVRIPENAELIPLDPEIHSVFEATIVALPGLGLTPIRIALPRSFLEYQADTGAIMAREAYDALHQIVDDPSLPLDPAVRARVAQGARISDSTYTELIAQRANAVASIDSLLGAGDILMLPTTPFPARALKDVDESIFPMSRLTRLVNYLDLCAVSVPAGTTSDGLPMGLQLGARGGSEALLLDMAERLQSVGGGI